MVGYSPNVSTQGIEFFFEGGVAPIQMMNASDFGGALGSERSQYQRRAGSQVRGHHGRSGQPRYSLNDGGSAADANVGPHPNQFRSMPEAIREDPVGDHAGSGHQ